jgi:hypothetical protein
MRPLCSTNPESLNLIGAWQGHVYPDNGFLLHGLELLERVLGRRGRTRVAVYSKSLILSIEDGDSGAGSEVNSAYSLHPKLVVYLQRQTDSLGIRIIVKDGNLEVCRDVPGLQLYILRNKTAHAVLGWRQFPCS